MGIRNPGGSVPFPSAIAGKTAYVSPAFTQNANGYYSTVNGAIASFGAIADIGPYEVVIYPGTYLEDMTGMTLVNGITWVFRGMAGAEEITRIRKGNFGLQNGAGNYFVYVSNLTFTGAAGSHGVECFCNGAGNIYVRFEDCIFLTPDAPRYAFYDNIQNVAGNQINTFLRCRFQNTNAGTQVCYNNNNRHNGYTTWIDCQFDSRLDPGFSATYTHRTMKFLHCIFNWGHGFNASAGGLADRVIYERCEFNTNSYIQSNVVVDADQPQVYADGCTFYVQVNWQLRVNAHFKNCSWIFISGATNDAIFIDTNYSVIRYDNCVIHRGRLKLANTVANTQIKLTNCTFHNPLGAAWVDTDPAGAAGVTAYNCNTDQVTGAGIAVAGAGNNIGVAI